jgi:hypothetical protein
MSLVENIPTLPQPRTDNYGLARFNALQHGVLSRHSVLPWENPEEYRVLLEALVAEHSPQGPTEEHLVEELAGIVWRKRRLRLAEGAAYHRALMRATEPDQETAKAALIHIAAHDGEESLGEAIRATESQTAEELADLEGDQAMTKEALCLTPYQADGKGLKRFLESEVLPWYEKRSRELDHRPMIRAQVFGQAIDPHRLERLARYEARQPATPQLNAQPFQVAFTPT